MNKIRIYIQTIILLALFSILSTGVSSAKHLNYLLELDNAQRDLKLICKELELDKITFEKLDAQQTKFKKINSDNYNKFFRIQSDTGKKVKEYYENTGGNIAGVRRANALAAGALAFEKQELEELRKQDLANTKKIWALDPIRGAARESFAVNEIVKARALAKYEKLKKNKPGQIIEIKKDPVKKKKSPPGNGNELDAEIEELNELIRKLREATKPGSPGDIDRDFLNARIADNSKIIKNLLEINHEYDLINDAIKNKPVDNSRAVKNAKHVHPVKPVNKKIAKIDPQENIAEPSESDPEYNVRYELNGGVVFARLPKFNLGITNFNTNFTPLHSVKPNIISAEVGGKLIIDPEYGSGVNIGVGWSYSRGYGSESQTIPAFAPGQLPTVIDISGNGGIGINENSRFRLDIDHFNWTLNGELGYQSELLSGITVKPYAGIFYQRSDTRYRTNIDTDFLGGTFTGTADERIKQDQFGADIGLDFSGAIGSNLTPEAQKLARFFWIAGAHLGAARTNSRYTGFDCGDSNRFIAGCDGGLYLNNNIKAKNNSWDFFGGIKAGLAIYVLCRENPAAVAAAVIDTAVSRLKESCVELSLTGSWSRIPDAQIVRSNTIGGGQVALDQGRSDIRKVRFGVTFKF